jgi:hypothetical protein
MADALRDRYVIERKLGGGSFASEHIARDLGARPAIRPCFQL